MTQTWDPKNYAQNAAFVPGMADEILPASASSTWDAETVN